MMDDVRDEMGEGQAGVLLLPNIDPLGNIGTLRQEKRAQINHPHILDVVTVENVYSYLGLEIMKKIEKKGQHILVTSHIRLMRGCQRTIRAATTMGALAGMAIWVGLGQGDQNRG